MTEIAGAVEIGACEGYEWAIPEDDDGHEALASIDHHIEARSWPRPRFELVTRARGRRFRRATMPWCNDEVLVLRDEAIERVGPLLSGSGIFLPVSCDDAALVLFYAWARSDALDVGRSSITRFPSSGRVMRIDRPVLHAACLAEPGAFRVAESPRGPTFMTDDVAEGIQQTGIATGALFTDVEIS